MLSFGSCPVGHLFLEFNEIDVLLRLCPFPSDSTVQWNIWDILLAVYFYCFPFLIWLPVSNQPSWSLQSFLLGLLALCPFPWWGSLFQSAASSFLDWVDCLGSSASWPSPHTPNIGVSLLQAGIWTRNFLQKWTAVDPLSYTFQS